MRGSVYLMIDNKYDCNNVLLTSHGMRQNVPTRRLVADINTIHSIIPSPVST